jgi:hypothetical protein
MTLIGEIQRIVPGRKLPGNYMWHSCVICGKERWVDIVKGEPTADKCRSCAANGRVNTNSKHHLSQIDKESRTAICKSCGLVRIKPRSKNLSERWRCSKASNKYQYDREKKRGWHHQRQHRRWVGSICERCGFIPEDCCQLDVHHKDKDHKNNKQENLITLCANCHRLGRVGKLIV